MSLERSLPFFTALFFTCFIALGDDEHAYPGKDWPRATPAEVGLDEAALKDARKYALTGEGAGCITRHGKLVMTWGDVDRRYDLKSTSKSIGVTALGLAMKDGHIKLDDKANKHHPSLGVPPDANNETGWLDDITIFHLATQTAGFEKPGGYRKLLFKPGTKWLYSDGGPNWLAECVTLKYKRDVQDVMFDRVFTPLGIDKDDVTWRNNAYREKQIAGVARREFGSGVHANVDAMARIGYLYLRRGKWRDKQILDESFIDLCRQTPKQLKGLPEHDGDNHGNASDHYGLLWWNNNDGTLKDVPRDAYWSWGLYDSLIVVIPSLDIVVSRAGKSWKREKDGEHYDVLKPFLTPIVKAGKEKVSGGETNANLARTRATERHLDTNMKSLNVELTSNARAKPRSGSPPAPLPLREGLGEGGAEFPPERTAFPTNAQTTNTVFIADTQPTKPLIKTIKWSPPDTIKRAAKGSDNWPVTWGDDDALYTAYGDGWGFAPRRPRKLSLGLAKVTGPPDDFKGANIPTETGEQLGDGKHGKKASGILMVDGVLYMFVRNADLSQLAVSRDRGKTWQWSDWRFEKHFAAPTFLNFGRDYAGVPKPHEKWVYVYSFDAKTAYDPADRMVLTRVPKEKILQGDAYEFFVARGDDGQPQWSSKLADCGAVFTRKQGCYRSGVSYNAGLKRYLWAQILPGGDTRFEGGIAVCEATQPWGPWREVWRDEKWDVGPGESANFPTKWMSDDGRTVHLVFSGDDCFSVRKATLITK